MVSRLMRTLAVLAIVATACSTSDDTTASQPTAVAEPTAVFGTDPSQVDLMLPVPLGTPTFEQPTATPTPTTVPAPSPTPTPPPETVEFAARVVENNGVPFLEISLLETLPDDATLAVLYVNGVLQSKSNTTEPGWGWGSRLTDQVMERGHLTLRLEAHHPITFDAHQSGDVPLATSRKIQLDLVDRESRPFVETSTRDRSGWSVHTHGPFTFVGTADDEPGIQFTDHGVASVGIGSEQFSYSDSATTELWFIEPSVADLGVAVLLIDGVQFDETRFILPPGEIPFTVSGVVAGSAGLWLFDADPAVARLALLDAESQSIVRVVEPSDLAAGITAGLSRVYESYSNQMVVWIGTSDGTVAALDSVTGDVLHQVQVGDSPVVDLAHRGTNVVALDADGVLHQIDTVTLDVESATPPHFLVRIGTNNSGITLVGVTDHNESVLLTQRADTPLADEVATSKVVSQFQVEDEELGDVVVQESYPFSLVVVTMTNTVIQSSL